MKYTGDTLPGKPSNVMTGKWLPQLDILSHPKIRLFISHGGLMGTLEAVYAGVPIVGIPLFADQELNIKRCVLQGFAVRLLYDDITKESLLSAIRTLLDDPRYAANAKKTSFQFRDRPQTALETAVYWVEYVIRHRGAPHLRSAGADLPNIPVLAVGRYISSSAWCSVFLVPHIYRHQDCVEVTTGAQKEKQVQKTVKRSLVQIPSTSFHFQSPLYHFNGGLMTKEEELEDERMEVFLVTRPRVSMITLERAWSESLRGILTGVINE
uniref:UDP-glucuronosyltransferase n=1 Tax=Timema monikensis TaxID=170555 RepID=A0A7R9E6A9_9NEOP|nr:unnamed protein product [Timema monikensis]